LVVLIIGIVTNVVPQILDSVPFLPQYELKAMPVERLSNPSEGQYDFVNFVVLKSNKVTSGSDVRGNVTFYYSSYGWMFEPVVRVLTEGDYIRAGPGDSTKLSVATLSDLGPCCTNSTYSGYRIGFNFTSEQTTSYYFLFYPGARQIIVEIFRTEKGAPAWKTYSPWIFMVLGVIGVLLSFREELAV
jgi:hypothetical protein